MGLGGGSLSLNELADLGVKRVSIGSALARMAYGAFLRAAEEIRREGSFTFAEEAVPFAKINAIFRN
jgi:2-methylisocitrate lyase-like PEP mutase family enzyme